MAARMNDLQLFTLEHFYDCFRQPLARELFMKTITLKLEGYLHEYRGGTLPLDSTDYVGVHHVLCRKVGRDYVPLMAYKSVSLERCLAHNLHFPATTILGPVGKDQALERTRQAVRAVVDRFRTNPSRLTYDSSWTIDPETRKDRPLVQQLRDIFLTAHLFHSQREEGTASVICGIFRFKTEQFFAGWGYQPCATEDGSMPLFRHAFLSGEKAVMMYAERYSESAWETARRYEAIWRNRILIGPAEAGAARKKAA
jgi:hypothetical protein